MFLNSTTLYDRHDKIDGRSVTVLEEGILGRIMTRSFGAQLPDKLKAE